MCSLWGPEAGGETPVSNAWRKVKVNAPVMMSVGCHALLILAVITYASSPVMMSGGGQSNASSDVQEFTAVQLSPQPPISRPQDGVPATGETPKRAPLPVSEHGTVALPASKKVLHSSEKPSTAMRATHSTGKSVAVARRMATGRTQHAPAQRRPPVGPESGPARGRTSDGVAAENIARESPQNTGNSNTAPARAGAGQQPHATVRALTRRVSYPQRAKALGVEGRVKLRFDVTAGGMVTHVQITEENPAGVFSGELYKDIARWRYQKGAAAGDQTVTIIFKLSGAVALTD